MDYSELLKYAATAFAGAATAILAERRAERKRRRELLEAAVGLWLDGNHALAAELDRFGRLLCREPETLEEPNAMVKELENLQASADRLASALHKLLLYEKRPRIREILDLKTRTYDLMVQRCEDLTSYQKTHSWARQHLASYDASERGATDKPSETAEQRAALAGLESKLRDALAKRRSHLSEWSIRLAQAGEKFSEDARSLRDSAAKLRRLLTSGS